MKLHNKKLQFKAKTLRNNLTPHEIKLWNSIRSKQILGVKFLRQKIIGNFIVDFYSASIKLAIEIDGGQHYEESNIIKDQTRDLILVKYGIETLRFTNFDISTRFGDVMEKVYYEVSKRKSMYWIAPNPYRFS